MSREKIEFYKSEGYLILDILSPEELEKYSEEINKLLSGRKNSNETDRNGENSSSYQHFGDNFKEFGTEAKHYYFHLITNPGTEGLHPILLKNNLRQIAEELVGPNLILNNFSLLAAEPGTKYKLGWHRDIIQIPEEQIDPRIFSKQWRHNNIQGNLAINPDSCLWAVPGSHSRPNTPEENEAFAGSKHYAPADNVMPGGVPIELKPGQIVLYNNNLIHRGYCDILKSPRRTIHLGFHSAKYPPTWHFYLFDDSKFTQEYINSLSPEIQEMVEQYLDLKKAYPNMEDTWPKLNRPLEEVLER